MKKILLIVAVVLISATYVNAQKVFSLHTVRVEGNIAAFEKVQAPYVGSYVHINKIAAVVGLSSNVNNAAVLVKDLAMQVASMGATTLSYKDFDAEFIASETEARIAVIEKDNIELGRLGKTLKNIPQYISMAQLTENALSQAEDAAKAELKAEGKPEQIWDKILPGKMERFISDNTTLDQEQCLLDQNFIKDDKVKVAKYVASYGEVEITEFKRVSLG
jgi:elongation factor Ts